MMVNHTESSGESQRGKMADNNNPSPEGQQTLRMVTLELECRVETEPDGSLSILLPTDLTDAINLSLEDEPEADRPNLMFRMVRSQHDD